MVGRWGVRISLFRKSACCFFPRNVHNSRRRLGCMTPPPEDASVEALRAALSRECSGKMSERRGRINAERELREVKLKLMAMSMSMRDGDVGGVELGRRTEKTGVDAVADNNETARHGTSQDTASTSCRVSGDDQLKGTTDGPPGLTVFPLTPIGTFQSCFTCRNGTPRQPQLVPLARGRLTLAKHVQGCSLEGLEQFSHVWLVYVFHKNTDLHVGMGGLRDEGGDNDKNRTTSRSKVRVPRLNGERRGVLATRSPHRPNPVGMSLCRIRSVDVKHGVLEVEGADLVDETPVLDIKPYLPFCEALSREDSFAPIWVDETSSDPNGEPLLIASVEFEQGAEACIREVWRARNSGMKKGTAFRSLYQSGEEFCAFCKQALQRDIRSFHQRERVDLENEVGTQGKWEVVLDGISVRYDVCEGKVVIKGGGVTVR